VLIQKEFNSGLNGNQICKKYNLNKQTVYTHMQNIGLYVDDGKDKWRELHKIIVDELNNGSKNIEIIRKYGINQSTFYRHYGIYRKKLRIENLI
jgi:DNA invertase Pin-like site-specific DNA recombinase